MPTERFLHELPSKPANEIEAARLEAWLMYEISKKQKFDSARKYWAGIACQIEAMPQDRPEPANRGVIHLVGGAQ